MAIKFFDSTGYKKVPIEEFWKKIDASKNLLLEQMINEGIVLNGAEDNPEESDGEKVIANCSFANDWTFGEKIKDMQLDRESSDDMHWLLSGTLDWINVKKEDGKELDWNKVSQLLSISSSTSATKGFKLDKFLSSYIQGQTDYMNSELLKISRTRLSIMNSASSS